MRRPPISSLPRRPVTAGVGLAALATMALYRLSGLDVSVLLVEPRSVLSAPWTLVTSTVVHVDVLHLGFNVYWLWMLGAHVEEVLGRARFAGLIVFLAIGSSAAESALFDGGMGLSGVVYGLVGFLWMYQRRTPGFEAVVDPPTFRFFGGWFVLCIVLTIAEVWPIANAAHGAGALLGAGVGWLATTSARAPAAITLLATLALTLLGATVLRPFMNVARVFRPGDDEAYAGYLALQRGSDDEACELLERAVSLDDDHADRWFNLGLAHHRLGRHDRARAAYAQACRLAPEELNYCETSRALDDAAEAPSPDLGSQE